MQIVFSPLVFQWYRYLILTGQCSRRQQYNMHHLVVFVSLESHLVNSSMQSLFFFPDDSTYQLILFSYEYLLIPVFKKYQVIPVFIWKSIKGYICRKKSLYREVYIHNMFTFSQIKYICIPTPKVSVRMYAYKLPKHLCVCMHTYILTFSQKKNTYILTKHLCVYVRSKTTAALTY